MLFNWIKQRNFGVFIISNWVANCGKKAADIENVYRRSRLSSPHPSFCLINDNLNVLVSQCCGFVFHRRRYRYNSIPGKLLMALCRTDSCHRYMNFPKESRIVYLSRQSLIEKQNKRQVIWVKLCRQTHLFGRTESRHEPASTFNLSEL